MLQDQINELRDMLNGWLETLDQLEQTGETPEMDFGSLVDDISDSVRYLN